MQAPAAPVEAPKPITPVNVFSPEGDLASIDSDKLPKALEQGFREATPEEVDDHFLQEKYGTSGQMAKTALEGAASAATFGASTGLEKAFGATNEDINARRKANPGSHALGQIAGLVGTSVIPGLGEASAAKAIEGTGVAAAKLLGLGEESANLMSQIGAKTVSEGAGMALFQGGDAVSKMISSDPDQSVHTAIADIGLASLIGAGTGAVFGAAAPLWKASVGDKAGQIAADFGGRAKFHLDNPDPAAAMAEELGKHQEMMEGIRHDVYGAGGLKQEALGKLLPEKLTPEIQQATRSMLDKVKETVADMRANSESYSGSHIKAIENTLSGIEDRLNPSISGQELLRGVRPETASAVEHFNEMEGLKKQLQGLAKYNGPPLVQGSPEANFLKKVRGLATETKAMLEQPEIWGKAGDLQQSLNKAAAAAIKPSELFQKRFMAIAGDGSRVIDPGKINTFVNQLGKHSADIKQDVLETYLKQSEAVRDEVSKIYQRLGVPNPIEPPGLSVTKTLLQAPTTGSKLADAAIHHGLADVAGRTLGGAIGAGLGHPLGLGYPGGAAGQAILGPGIARLIHPMVRPIMEKAANGAALKSSIDYASAVAKGESRLNKAAKAVFKMYDKPTTSLAASTLVRDREKLKKAVLETQQDPASLGKVGGDIGHYLPTHATIMAATAANAINFLNSQRPDTQPKMPLDSKLPPEPGKVANYNRMLDIANHPLHLMTKIATGSITSQEITGIKTMYPGLYNTITQKLMNEMTDSLAKGTAVPYHTRIGLSLWAGQPLDSTMTPQAIIAAQPKPQAPPPQQGSPGKPPSASSTKGIDKMSSSSQTANQSREQRAQRPK
jgi:hypothetical protein